MDRERLLDDLPDTLAVALRLEEAGHSRETVATALGVPVQSVSVVLKVARLKLARLKLARLGDLSNAAPEDQ